MSTPAAAIIVVHMHRHSRSCKQAIPVHGNIGRIKYFMCTVTRVAGSCAMTKQLFVAILPESQCAVLLTSSWSQHQHMRSLDTHEGSRLFEKDDIVWHLYHEQRRYPLR